MWHLPGKAAVKEEVDMLLNGEFWSLLLKALSTIPAGSLGLEGQSIF
jgi:hypothetical protein